MSDQWDPKYPKYLWLWCEDYQIARETIYRADSLWRPAFVAVVEAEEDGELRDLQEFHRGTSDSWSWWMGVWDLYYKPMFLQDISTWPAYAKAVYDAVPQGWVDGGPGRLGGIPLEWSDDRKRIWAFKTTVLFAAGLIEGFLPADPAPAAAGIEEIVEEKVDRALRSLAGGAAGRGRMAGAPGSRGKPAASGMGGVDPLVQQCVLQMVERTLQPLLHGFDELDDRRTTRR